MHVTSGRPVGPAGKYFGAPSQQQWGSRILQHLLHCSVSVAVLLQCCIYLVFYIPLMPLMAAFMREQVLINTPGLCVHLVSSLCR